MIFWHGFWLAGGCAASQSDAEVWKSLLTYMDFNMEIS